jgi:UDP:flavonoid glycosyltransferase YjiC (YdhE family)
MSDLLFVTWDGGGNVPPLLALAGELHARGHGVRVMGHPQQAGAVAAAGLRFVPFAGAPAFSSTERNSPLRLVRLFGDKVMGRDVVAELQARPADLVVVDCLLFGAMDAVRRAGTPYVVLEHLFDGYLRGPLLHGPIGLGMRAKRLHPHALLDDAEQCLVATLPELDPVGGPAANRVHTGPFVTAEPATPEEPTVLLSLSTYRYGGMLEVWQRALDAAGELPVRVVATTGPAVDAGRLRAPDNVEMRTWASHGELMPTVSAVVGHGGHATTMLALAHGLPLLVLPLFRFVDQPMVGRAVQDAGAGLTIAKKSSAQQIRGAVERLLADPGYATGARRLSQRIRDLDGLHRAADAVETLVAADGRGSALASCRRQP